MPRLLVLLLIACSMVRPLSAQPDFDLKKIRQEYPNEKVVNLKMSREAEIKQEDGQLKIYTDYYETRLYLDQSAHRYGEESISFSRSFENVRDIEARTYVPKGNGRYDRLKVKEESIESRTKSTAGIFYDDLEEKHFSFPGLQQYAVSELSYTEVQSVPEFFGAFFLQDFAPSRESVVKVTFPKSVKIKYLWKGQKPDDFSFSEKTAWGKTTYTWRAKNVEKYEHESHAPSPRHYLGHLLLFISEYKKDGQTVKVLSDVEQLYKWYYDFIDDLNQAPSPAIQAITDSLVAGASSGKEKAKRIFYWVQDHIKYIAFEDGLGGFVPREASKVCQRKYGDCKDMSSLTQTMMQYAGLDAHLTWVGTRDIPYRYAEVHSPMADNHMIVSALIGGKRLFFDATGQYVPFGFPTSMIQGKEALVAGSSAQDFEVAQVPVMPKKANTSTDRLQLRLKGQTLHGEGQRGQSGYQRYFSVYRLKNLEEQEKAKHFRKRLQQGENNFFLEDFSYSGHQNRDSNFVIDYRFHLEDYARQIGQELFLNLNLDRSFSNGKFDLEQRELDREMKYRYVDEYDYTFQLPDSYRLSYLPEDAAFEGEEFGFSIRYEKIGEQKVRYHKRVYVDTLMIEKSQFEQWNEMVDQLTTAYNEMLVLKKQP